MKKNKGRNNGFSIVELIVVIAIIGILVALIAMALMPYIEKTKATSDYNALDSFYTSYSMALSEITDYSTGKIDGSDLDSNFEKMVLENLGYDSMLSFQTSLKSEQFKGTTVKSFLKKDANGNIVMYGIRANGKNGYTGIQIDSKGTKCVINKKGNSSSYVDQSSGDEKEMN